MRLHVKKYMGGLAVLVVGLALLAPARAAIDDFKLTKVIPADVALAVHAHDHAGKAFLKTQYERVWKTVEAQHFEKDVRTLLKGLYQENNGDPEEFDKQWQQFNDLLLGVEWSSLFEREFAFTMKMGFPTAEIVVLGVSAPEKAKTNFQGLEAILKTLIAMAPPGQLTLSTQGEGDSVVDTLPLPLPLPGVTLSVILARQKDVLMLGFGSTLPEQTLALLKGEAGQSLASTPRFQEAFKGLPAPTDGLMFFDLARFVGQMRALLDKAMSMGDPTGEQLDPKIKALPGKIIDAFDMCEYMANVTATEGMKTTEQSVVVFRPDAKSRAGYKVFFGNGPLTDPLKFIPEKAQNFTVWSGFDLRALYDAVINFVRDEVPDGPAHLAEWDQGKQSLKEEYNLDVEKDLLDWVGGGISTFTIPGKSSYSPGAFVLMLSVKDEAKAKEMVDRLLKAIEPMLTQNNGLIDDASKDGAEGFKIIVHPLLGLVPVFPQPTLGVKNGHLFLGSSPKAVVAALETAAGTSPNFATNERFKKEGLPVEKNVLALSFTDLSRWGEELGQGLKMIPMVAMAMPQLTQHPAGRALLSAVSKLGVVVTELNFFQSSCSETTFDGQTLRTKTIINYQEPPAKPATTAPAETQPAGEKPAASDK